MDNNTWVIKPFIEHKSHEESGTMPGQPIFQTSPTACLNKRSFHFPFLQLFSAGVGKLGLKGQIHPAVCFYIWSVTGTRCLWLLSLCDSELCSCNKTIWPTKSTILTDPLRKRLPSPLPQASGRRLGFRETVAQCLSGVRHWAGSKRPEPASSAIQWGWYSQPQRGWAEQSATENKWRVLALWFILPLFLSFHKWRGRQKSSFWSKKKP